MINMFGYVALAGGTTMTNAKEELLEHVDNDEVSYIKIVTQLEYGADPVEIKGTLEEVLPLLDFVYEDEHGGQHLFGYIWYTDGTWSSREYDGSEWWEFHKCPDKSISVYPY